MSQEINKIKSRIKSVSGALKVTSAMKLVSTVKLKKWKNKMLSNREYTNQISDTTELILSYVEKYQTPFNQINKKATKNLYIVVSSTLGLCGAYNSNIFKLAETAIKENDDAIILGNKGILYFKDGKFNKNNDFNHYSSVNDSSILREINNFMTTEYLKGTYREIHIIYSEFKNALIFKPVDYKILPLENISKNHVDYGPLLEPSEKDLVDTLIPIYLKTLLYAKLLESEVCEQASRSNAMENATNNANELLDNLKLVFNKARQAAITQEIVEIVGASEAL